MQKRTIGIPHIAPIIVALKTNPINNPMLPEAIKITPVDLLADIN